MGIMAYPLIFLGLCLPTLAIIALIAAAANAANTASPESLFIAAVGLLITIILLLPLVRTVIRRWRAPG